MSVREDKKKEQTIQKVKDPLPSEMCTSRILYSKVMVIGEIIYITFYLVSRFHLIDRYIFFIVCYLVV